MNNDSLCIIALVILAGMFFYASYKMNTTRTLPPPPQDGIDTGDPVLDQKLRRRRQAKKLFDDGILSAEERDRMMDGNL